MSGMYQNEIYKIILDIKIRGNAYISYGFRMFKLSYFKYKDHQIISFSMIATALINEPSF